MTVNDVTSNIKCKKITRKMDEKKNQNFHPF